MNAKQPLCVADPSKEYPPNVDNYLQHCEILSPADFVDMWKTSPDSIPANLSFADPLLMEELAARMSGESSPIHPAFSGRQALLKTLTDAAIPTVRYLPVSDTRSALAAARELSEEGPWLVCADRGRRERAMDDVEDVTLAYRYASSGAPTPEATVEINAVHPSAEEEEHDRHHSIPHVEPGAMPLGLRITLQGVRSKGVVSEWLALTEIQRKYHRYPIGLDTNHPNVFQLLPLLSGVSSLVNRALSAVEVENSPFSITLATHFTSIAAGAERVRWAVEDVHLCPWWGPAPVDLSEMSAEIGWSQWPNASEIRPSKYHSVHVRWLDIEPGLVEDVTGVTNTIPCIERVVINAKSGDTVRHMVSREDRDKIGYIVAVGRDGVDETESIKKAMQDITIVTTKMLRD